LSFDAWVCTLRAQGAHMFRSRGYALVVLCDYFIRSGFETELQNHLWFCVGLAAAVMEKPWKYFYMVV
jgi:hypothetical protein